jgi:hypothetical protein
LKGRRGRGKERAVKYEATINFDVKDEAVDLTELLAHHKIDIRGTELVGRTDKGDESAWQMASIPAAVEWRDDEKQEISQATKETSRRLGVAEEAVEQLVEWMS